MKYLKSFLKGFCILVGGGGVLVGIDYLIIVAPTPIQNFILLMGAVVFLIVLCLVLGGVDD